MNNKIDILNFFENQLGKWPLAAANFAALEQVEIRTLKVRGFDVKVQYNPGRAFSTGAKVDPASIKERKCYLCKQNRPSVQDGIDWGEHYTILVNPYPIFPGHLTIADSRHVSQAIRSRIIHLYDLAKELEDYIVFYNGPRCGASAPDHAHFQAVPFASLPLPTFVSSTELMPVLTVGKAVLSRTTGLPMNVFVLDSDNPHDARTAFRHLYKALPQPFDDGPMINVLAYRRDKGIRFIIIPRKRHRPSFYGTEGDKVMMISPAAVDLAGVFITPRRCDFDKIKAEDIEKILDEVCLSDEEISETCSRINCEKVQPDLSVGLMSGVKFIFNLKGNYIVDGEKVTGMNVVERSESGNVIWNSDYYTEILFEAENDECTFEIEGIVIGKGFHWERKETQRFKGSLKIIGGPEMTAINIIKIEDYLESVISSEMSATAPIEFLKAHSVISRSWILSQIWKHERILDSEDSYESLSLGSDEIIRWYDREDHTLFHVCADDHCQRYQGINRQSTPAIAEVIKATRGTILVDENDDICDARFSKCCGGVFEEFENCWEPCHYPYLEARRDTADEDNFPDLTKEENAIKWIMSSPESYCNTDNKDILSHVLNSYDQETTDFYRWKVVYTQEELSKLISSRSGINFGRIKALEAVERGTSGRIVRLRIVGEFRTIIIGKELEIRRVLSPSHLYSSAFVCDPIGNSNSYPTSFVLYGAGWGHGVGLCQIGAAVMASEGMKYEDILAHYFKGSKLKKIYN